MQKTVSEVENDAQSHLLWPEPDWIEEAVEKGWQWPRIMWRRAASQPGAWFDDRKAEAAVRMFPEVFSLTDDRFAGKPFTLSMWEEVIVRMLTGWKVPEEVVDEQTGKNIILHIRLFRRLFLWIPRKNGKTEFLSALGLLFFILDGVIGGQGYAFARDEEQAKICFGKMKAMLSMAGDRLKAQPFDKTIYVPETRSLFTLLPGTATGKHGKSASVIVGDEMHEWANRDLEDTLRKSTGARLEPIELYASTAGVKSNPAGWELWELSRKILDGTVTDPTTLVVIFALDADEDWSDEENWKFANPSLGVSPTMKFMRLEAAMAAESPRAEAAFKCYHLNQWIDQISRWLNMKRWDSCKVDGSDWKAMKEGKGLQGRRCFAAVDVSATQDVTCRMLAFIPDKPGGRWELSCRFWVPEESAKKRIRDDKVPYDEWIESGALEVTPGDYVDQDYVKKALIDDMKKFDVELIGFDPWNAVKLMGDLQKEGVNEDMCVEMRQGIRTLGEPSKAFERLVMSEKIDHGGHPLLRWMAGNAAVRFDENLNFMPTKKHSAEKIDGIVAAVMAIGLSMIDQDVFDMDDYISNVVMVT